MSKTLFQLIEAVEESNQRTGQSWAAWFDAERIADAHSDPEGAGGWSGYADPDIPPLIAAQILNRAIQSNGRSLPWDFLTLADKTTSMRCKEQLRSQASELARRMIRRPPEPLSLTEAVAQRDHLRAAGVRCQIKCDGANVWSVRFAHLDYFID